jgi:hypothetical protein
MALVMLPAPIILWGVHPRRLHADHQQHATAAASYSRDRHPHPLLRQDSKRKSKFAMPSNNIKHSNKHPPGGNNMVTLFDLAINLS